MGLRKRHWVMGSVGALLAFLIGGAVFGACHRGFGPGRFHPGFHKAHDPDRILEHMDKKVADLELDASQQAVYHRIRGEIREDLVRFGEGHKTFRESVRQEMQKDDPDVDAVVERLKGGMDHLHELMSAHLDRMVELYEVLDEDQKKQVLDRVRDRMERCRS